MLAVVRDAPESFVGMGWDTPINAGFVTKPPATAGSSWASRCRTGSICSTTTPSPGPCNAHLPDATVVATDGHDWVRDPYSKGTWLSTPPGWFSDGTFEALATHEGRLAFAGSDIATEGAGWIEGAVASGPAAAAYTLGLLTSV